MLRVSTCFVKVAPTAWSALILFQCVATYKIELNFITKLKTNLILNKSTEAPFDDDSNKEPLNVTNIFSPVIENK